MGRRNWMAEEEEPIGITYEQNEIEKKYLGRKKNSKYNSSLKNAFQSVMDTEVTTPDGNIMSMAEAIALNTAKDAIEHPNVDKAIGIAKMTGEYTEKNETTVNNLEEIIKACNGDKF